MSNKTKTQTTSQKIGHVATQAGLVLMAGAATLGMIDLPDRFNSRIITLPNQPAFAWANNNLDSKLQNNSLRREREEVAPHFDSYSVVHRTAGRTGRL